MELNDCVLGLLEYLVVKGYNAAATAALCKFFYLIISVIVLMRGPEFVQCAGTGLSADS